MTKPMKERMRAMREGMRLPSLLPSLKSAVAFLLKGSTIDKPREGLLLLFLLSPHSLDEFEVCWSKSEGGGREERKQRRKA